MQRRRPSAPVPADCHGRERGAELQFPFDADHLPESPPARGTVCLARTGPLPDAGLSVAARADEQRAAARQTVQLHAGDRSRMPLRTMRAVKD